MRLQQNVDPPIGGGRIQKPANLVFPIDVGSEAWWKLGRGRRKRRRQYVATAGCISIESGQGVVLEMPVAGCLVSKEGKHLLRMDLISLDIVTVCRLAKCLQDVCEGSEL